MNWIRNAFTHWKTTIVGVGLAVLQVVINGRDSKSLALAAAQAALGAIAKDPGGAR